MQLSQLGQPSLVSSRNAFCVDEPLSGHNTFLRSSSFVTVCVFSMVAFVARQQSTSAQDSSWSSLRSVSTNGISLTRLLSRCFTARFLRREDPEETREQLDLVSVVRSGYLEHLGVVRLHVSVQLYSCKHALKKKKLRRVHR